MKYLIINLNEGIVEGTNSKEEAYEYSYSDDYYVVDTENKVYILEGGMKDPKPTNGMFRR